MNSLRCGSQVYEFLVTKYPEKVDAAIHRQILEAGDLKGKIIAQNTRANELCQLTMDIFAGVSDAVRPRSSQS